MMRLPNMFIVVPAIVVPAHAGTTWQSFPRRPCEKQGPIRRGHSVLAPRPDAFFRQLTSVVMGPCVRRDDHDFRFSEIHLDGGVETVILSRCPVLLEGRFAIVKDVGRDAVDALALLTNGA